MVHIYTDGSCIKGCSSALAVCIPQYCFTSISKLSPFSVPLFAELHAIMMVLELVVNEPDDHLLLICDCLFALVNISFSDEFWMQIPQHHTANETFDLYFSFKKRAAKNRPAGRTWPAGRHFDTTALDN